MSQTFKQTTDYDHTQVLRKIYGEAGAISVEGWVFGLVGRRISVSITTTTIANDTEVYSYSELNDENVRVDILQVRNVYTDGTRNLMLYSERIA